MSTIAMNCRRRLLGGAAVGLCAPAVVLAQTALAQQQDPGALQPVDEAEELEEIVITGSRIARASNLTTPNPVTIIGSEDILKSGETDISTLLREIPALHQSLPANESSRNGAPAGVGQLNLRGLGTERTLVLVNGRRHVAGVPGTASVDISSIPVALIERVETLTGGASSVYGADGVSGVVNFILRDDFEGLDYRSQFSISEDGDGEEIFLSATGGTNFADGRGNAVVSAEWTHSEEIDVADRSFAGSGLASRMPNSPELAAALGLDPEASNVFATRRTLPVSSKFGIIWLQDDATAFDTGFVNLFLDPGNIPTIPGTDIPVAQVVDETGTLREFNPGEIFVNPFNAVGGDGIPTSPDIGFLQPEIDRVNVNGNVTYDIHDYVNLFVESKFTFSDTRQKFQVNGFNDDIPIALDNPFIPSALRDQMDALMAQGITPRITVSRDNLDVPSTSQADQYSFRVVAGLEGQFDNGWEYEVSYNYGQTERDFTNTSARVEDRLFAAIDAVALDAATVANLNDILGGNTIQALRNGVDGPVSIASAEDAQVGDIVCRSSIDPDAVPPVPPFPDTRAGFLTFDPQDGQCVPTSIFGSGVTNPAAADFIFQNATENSELNQQVVSAILSGDSADYFALPGGPLGFAIGFEYREEKSQFEPSNFETGGLLFNTVTTRSEPVRGRFDVWEVFGEASLPLISDQPFIEDLTIDGAVRFADYSTVGDTLSWSFGGSWAPVQDIRLRGTFGRAIRAPNINELFSPPQPIFINADDDPCNANLIDAGSEFREQNCLELVGPGFDSTQFVSAFITGRAGGNPDLEEEEADTITIGGAITPRWLPGFSGTVDFWDVEIEDAIIVVDGLRIIENCVDAPTLDNQFCDLVQRDPEFGFITFFESGEQNIAALEARGIDFTANYSFDLAELGIGSWGSMNIGVIGTRTLRRNDFEFQEFPEEVDKQLGEFTFPKWILNVNATWSFQEFSLNWQTRFRSKQLLPGVENADLESNPLFTRPFSSGTAWVHDLSASYNILEGLQVNGGINNIADRDPFLASLTRPAGFRGRFFYLGVKGQF